MPNTKMNGKKLKLHFEYFKYIYAVIIIAALLVGNLLFSTTAYRAPNAHRIDIELIASYSNASTPASYEAQEILLAAGQAWEKTRDAEMGIDTEAADYKPALEELTVASLDYSDDGMGENDYYAAQKYMVLLAAQEGDIYFVSRQRMSELAEQGLLYPMDDYIESGIIDAGDRNLNRVTFDEIDDEENPTGETHVYALDVSTMTGMIDVFQYDPTDKYACILRFSQNPDTAAAIIGEMQRLYEEEPAETDGDETPADEETEAEAVPDENALADEQTEEAGDGGDETP